MASNIQFLVMATSGLDEQRRMLKAIRHFHDALHLRYPRHDLESKIVKIKIVQPNRVIWSVYTIQ